MAGVFISYRRDDSHGFAARLADDLGDILGEDLVFRDIEIPIGTDFGDVIHRAIAASDALLVVINRSWAERGPGGYADRLSDPSDWVRTEIEAAFAQEKQVVPILIGDTKMPAADMLPDGIRRLTALNAARMTDRHWNEDIAVLARQLRELCPALGATGRSPHKRDDLAAVLRELGERIVDQTELRRRTRSPQPKRHGNIFYPILRNLGRGLRRFLGSAFLVLAVYVGLRLFGDQEVLEMLNAVEARLMLGWERFQLYWQQAMN